MAGDVPQCSVCGQYVYYSPHYCPQDARDDEIASLRAKLQSAREVIRPFAKEAERWSKDFADEFRLLADEEFGFDSFTVGDLRRASSWMETGKEEFVQKEEPS